MRVTIIFLLVIIVAIKADFPNSKYVTNIRQITFGGHHTLPNFNFDGTQIVFTAKGGPYGMDCDQIYRLNLNDLNEKAARLSPGLGYATNAKYFPGNNEVTFESNFHKIAFPNDFTANKTCPISTCSKSGQDPTIASLCSKPTWDFFTDTDVFRFTEYGNIKDQLSFSPSQGYCGNAIVEGPTFDGQMLYYAQMDDLGINLYSKPLNQQRNPTLITEDQKTAYFGGISVNGDERRLAYHGYKPTDSNEVELLKRYLQNNLIPTTKMNIYFVSFEGFTPQIIDAVQNYSNFFPSFANTKGNKIVFTTNYGQTSSTNFGLYLYNINDFTLQQLLISTQFSIIHGAISKDYNKIVFASNKDSTNPNEYQLYLADFNVTGSSESTYDGGHFKIEKNDQTCWQNIPTNNLYDGIVHFPGEKHLKNVKQLTFGGQNAEGYFSFDDNMITLQATGLNNYGTGCDQIYQIDLCKDPKTRTAHKMSTGLGVCTCSFFYKDGKQSLYAGTFRNVKVDSNVLHDVTCPVKTCSEQNTKANATLADICKNAAYSWDINADYDIYLVNEYGIITKQLTNTPGYDAEGVVSPDGTMIAFTSMRNGDLDLYIMDLNGGNVRQITDVLGYDGGSFFSPDNKKLIFRASRPKTQQEINDYKTFLKYGIVVPLKMELFVINIDGTNMRQITHLGAANWAPYYLQDNKRVIFSSDFNATANFGAFDLYVINDDGTNLERVTWDDGKFDAFPMINHAGTKLIWGSSRNSAQDEINLFIADWVDPEQTTSANSILLPILTLIFVFFL